MPEALWPLSLLYREFLTLDKPNDKLDNVWHKLMTNQEAARSITFGTPLSALLKTIYSEFWD